MNALPQSLESIAGRKIVLFGGKGGVGKTTIASAAALHFAVVRPVILFTTDPASNIADLFPSGDDQAGDGPSIPDQLEVEVLDAARLHEQFLETHLEPFLEIGDRGTYLDREELRRLLQLALPGIDELMAWMRIGELAEANPESMLVVDTAPTGHTLRMLASSQHFRQIAAALDAMQGKHRAMVRQFTRRSVRDAMDAFIDDFEQRAIRRRDVLCDRRQTAFVPVTLSQPLVLEQTASLISELRDSGIDVPFVALNRAVSDADCERDRMQAERDSDARARFEPLPVVDAPRSCVPLDSVESIVRWSRGASVPPDVSASSGSTVEGERLEVRGRILFLAGKGGVGKTSCAVSIAIQLALRSPGTRHVVISVDPAHSLRDLFASITPPPGLLVETIDTHAEWERFRETVGDRIGEAFDALTPDGMSVGYDAEAMTRLVEIAPPGADEIFAIVRLSELVADETISTIVVDTAPTGHFLRLLDLPRVAGEWVREFMRIVLHYRELVPVGSLGEELLRASRALKEIEALLRSDDASVIAVSRPERIVVAETKRLMSEIEKRGIRAGGVIANYVTPESDCACDRSMRAAELSALGAIGRAVLVQRRDEPPATLEGLTALVPLR